jgi:hypothetical protein
MTRKERRALANAKWYRKYLERNREAGRTRAKKRWRENPESMKAASRRSYIKNADKRRAASREWRRLHPRIPHPKKLMSPQERAEARRATIIKHRARAKIRYREHRAENRPRLLAAAKRRHAANRERENARHRAYGKRPEIRLRRRENYPDSAQRLRQIAMALDLAEPYVRRSLSKIVGPVARRAPLELVTAHRAVLKVKRLIKRGRGNG